MKGEYDNLLVWPFQQKVTMALLDQTGTNHVVDSFMPDKDSTSFRRPESDMNIASGCPKFVAQSLLEHGKYVKDDTIMIKITVDLTNLREP